MYCLTQLSTSALIEVTVQQQTSLCAAGDDNDDYDDAVVQWVKVYLRSCHCHREATLCCGPKATTIAMLVATGGGGERGGRPGGRGCVTSAAATAHPDTSLQPQKMNSRGQQHYQSDYTLYDADELPMLVNLTVACGPLMIKTHRVRPGPQFSKC